jgi:hypothetical protein
MCQLLHFKESLNKTQPILLPEWEKEDAYSNNDIQFEMNIKPTSQGKANFPA